jgi:hypothetical protein
MANEILFSTLSGNARVSAVLHQTILEKLTDKASLVNHPYILAFNAMNGSGSSALQVPVVGLGGFVAYFTGGFVNGFTGMILQKTGSYITVFAYFSGMYLVSLLAIQLLVPRLEPERKN